MRGPFPPVVPDTVLHFLDAAEWRAWLEKNHARSSGAELLLSKVSVARGLHYLEALEEALCFGWIDSKGRAHDAERFAVRFSPRKADSVWSQSNRTRVTRLIREGRMTAAGRAKVREAKASGAWQEARRPSAKPRVPADLRDALRANPAAQANFRAFADSYKTAYIYWVLDARKPETRARRILEVVERAAKKLRPGEEG